MLEQGIVKKIDKLNYATIRFDRKTACENCNMCYKPKAENYVEIRVKNCLNADVGDNVSVEMAAKVVLTSSVIAYLIPIFLVFITLIATSGLEESLSFGLAMAVLAFSYVIVTLVDKILHNKKGYLPQMTAIISKEVQND